jgi:hypothetical protein
MHPDRAPVPVLGHYVPIAPALFLLCAVEDFAANVILPKEDRFTQTDGSY